MVRGVNPCVRYCHPVWQMQETLLSWLDTIRNVNCHAFIVTFKRRLDWLDDRWESSDGLRFLKKKTVKKVVNAHKEKVKKLLSPLYRFRSKTKHWCLLYY